MPITPELPRSSGVHPSDAAPPTSPPPTTRTGATPAGQEVKHPPAGDAHAGAHAVRKAGAAPVHHAPPSSKPLAKEAEHIKHPPAGTVHAKAHGAAENVKPLTLSGLWQGFIKKMMGFISSFQNKSLNSNQKTNFDHLQARLKTFNDNFAFVTSKNNRSPTSNDYENLINDLNDIQDALLKLKPEADKADLGKIKESLHSINGLEQKLMEQARKLPHLNRIKKDYLKEEMSVVFAEHKKLESQQKIAPRLQSAHKKLDKELKMRRPVQNAKATPPHLPGSPHTPSSAKGGASDRLSEDDSMVREEDAARGSPRTPGSPSPQTPPTSPVALDLRSVSPKPVSPMTDPKVLKTETEKFFKYGNIASTWRADDTLVRDSLVQHRTTMSLLSFLGPLAPKNEFEALLAFAKEGGSKAKVVEGLKLFLKGLMQPIKDWKGTVISPKQPLTEEARKKIETFANLWRINLKEELGMKDEPPGKANKPKK